MCVYSCECREQSTVKITSGIGPGRSFSRLAREVREGRARESCVALPSGFSRHASILVSREKKDTLFDLCCFTV